MKIQLLLLLLLYSIYGVANEGIPFFVNYPSTVYQAHNRNFDVICDRNGHVYIANFEGILHYDYHHWEIVHTPGYSRVTRLFLDTQGRIWVGGYNVFGRIIYNDRGRMELKTIVSEVENKKFGELKDIAETDGCIYLRTTSGTYYTVKNDSVLCSLDYLPEKLRKEWNEKSFLPGIKQKLKLSNGWTAQATEYNGLVVADEKEEKLFALTEQNGLCCNTISHIAADDKGNLWGATDKGVFRIYLPSLFSRYTSLEGLKGEVLSIIRYNKSLYVGTLQGLYILDRNTFCQIKGIKQACWALRISPDNQLYAATSDGVFRVPNKQRPEKIVNMSAFSLVFTDKNELTLGGLEGIYRFRLSKGCLEKVADLEKVMHLEKNMNGVIEARTLYGETFIQKLPDGIFVQLLRNDKEAMTTYTDKRGYCWWTDLKGKNLQTTYSLYDASRLNCYLSALRNYVVRTIFIEEKKTAWFGGDFGLVKFDLYECGFSDFRKPRIFLRNIILNGDSIAWGGFSAVNGGVPQWGSDIHSIRFAFATDAACFTGANMYRYKLSCYGDEWSDWSSVNYKEYANLSAGSYTFFVQIKDMYGNMSDVQDVSFILLAPFYLKWYIILAYILIFAGVMFLLFRWRMRKLLQEKDLLEDVVKQRTKELVEQKNEIEEKSYKLRTTLNELEQAQESLIRQEKMATVGKLTQGLIDRILNPLNYIINFSHLTVGLVQDLRQNLRDAREQLGEDIYQDSQDVLEMQASNIEKIEEHGKNTTRILKAMEEVLKNSGKQLEKLELTDLCEQCIKQLKMYYKSELEDMSVSVNVCLSKTPLYIKGNAGQLSKTLMSLFNNSMYAVIKKYNKKAYIPEISMVFERNESESQVMIILYDNGVGIEQTILDRIFDPFFTTKTTGEAAGIGLFLGNEIVQNHNGQLSVSSQKDSYTKFIITLPLLKEE